MWGQAECRSIKRNGEGGGRQDIHMRVIIGVDLLDSLLCAGGRQKHNATTNDGARRHIAAPSNGPHPLKMSTAGP